MSFTTDTHAFMTGVLFGGMERGLENTPEVLLLPVTKSEDDSGEYVYDNFRYVLCGDAFYKVTVEEVVETDVCRICKSVPVRKGQHACSLCD